MDITDRIGLMLASRRPRKASIKLTQNNIYIFPSKVGFAFLGLLLIMLLTAINYQNSLIYLFVFFLGAMFFISIWLCFLNLSGLTASSGQDGGCFVGEVAPFEVLLCKSGSEAFALNLKLNDHSLFLGELKRNQSERHTLLADVKPRGVHQLDRLYLRSDFPFGFIKGWTWLSLDSKVYVYPKPIDGHAAKEGSASSIDVASKAKSEDPSDIRSYQQGEPVSRILWKRYAMRDELVTRDNERIAQDDNWVRWSDYNVANIELKLSYMCYDVLALSSKRERFGLELPSTLISPGMGDTHKVECLKLLAEYA